MSPGRHFRGAGGDPAAQTLECGEAFQPGTSALFVLVRKSTPDKVLERLQGFKGKGKILKTSLTIDKEDELRKVLEKMDVDQSVE